MTNLQRVQLAVELDEVRKNKLEFIHLQYYEKAADLRHREKEIIELLETDIFTAHAVPKEYFGSKDDIYIKRDEMTDEQFSAFDEDGEPLQDNIDNQEDETLLGMTKKLNDMVEAFKNASPAVSEAWAKEAIIGKPSNTSKRDSLDRY